MGFIYCWYIFFIVKSLYYRYEDGFLSLHYGHQGKTQNMCFLPLWFWQSCEGDRFKTNKQKTKTRERPHASLMWFRCRMPTTAYYLSSQHLCYLQRQKVPIDFYFLRKSDWHHHCWRQRPEATTAKWCNGWNEYSNNDKNDMISLESKMMS